MVRFMKIRELKDQIGILTLDDQASLAQCLSSQALLSALYAKSLDMDQVRRDFSVESYSLLSVFDERGRLSILIEKFGEMMLTLTDTQFDKGERSNGWRDVSRSYMRDIVSQNLMNCLKNATELRLKTNFLEIEDYYTADETKE